MRRTLAWRRLREDFISADKYQKGGYQEDGVGLFLVVLSDRRMGNRHKQEYMKFHFSVTENYFQVDRALEQDCP